MPATLPRRAGWPTSPFAGALTSERTQDAEAAGPNNVAVSFSIILFLFLSPNFHSY